MLKILLKFFSFLIIVLLLLIGYLSFFGLETKSFNDLIQKERELQEFGMKKLGPQNSELVKIQNQLMQPILKVFSDACNKVGADKGYDFIFDAGTGGLLYSLEVHNITEDVLEEMNKLSTSSQ